MQTAKTGVVSGCIVWVILISVLGSCIFPCFVAAGSITSFSSYAIQVTGQMICPEGTTPTSYSYATTTTDEYGNSRPSTAYELHCVDAAGEVVKEDPVGYAFLWIGFFVVIGLILTLVLTFFLAAPAGALIARLLNRNKGNTLPG